MAVNDDSKNNDAYKFDQTDFPTLGSQRPSTKRAPPEQSAWTTTAPPKAVLSNSNVDRERSTLDTPIQNASKSGRMVFKAFSYSDTHVSSSANIAQPRPAHIARQDWRSARRQAPTLNTEGPWLPRYTPEQRDSAWAKDGNWRARNVVSRQEGTTAPFNNTRGLPSSSYSSSTPSSSKYFANLGTPRKQTARDGNEEEPKWKQSSNWRSKESES